jgi:hypothetical protein
MAHSDIPLGQLRQSPFLRWMADGEAIDLITGNHYRLGGEAQALIASCTAGRGLDTLSPREGALGEQLAKSLLLLTAEQQSWIRARTFGEIDLEVAGACNARCIFCPRDALKRGRGAGIMSRDVFFQIANKLMPVVLSVAFAGVGEPTLHPDLIELIRYFKDNDKVVGLVTNGSRLDDRLSDELLACNLDWLIVSFTGTTKESYETHMLGLRFAEVKEKVERLVKRASGRVPVYVSAVRTGRNRYELAGFVEEWEKKGAKARIAPCHSRGSTITDPEILGRLPGGRMVDGRCGLFNARSFVSWDGNLLACCHDVHGETVIGSLVSDSLDALIARKLTVIAEQRFFPICTSCDEPARLRTVTLG